MRCGLGVIGFLAFWFPAAAQETTSSALTLSSPQTFDGVDSAALLQKLQILTFLDGKALPISTELGRIGTPPLHIAWDTPSTIAKAHKSSNVSRHAADGKDFQEDEKNVSAGIMKTADPLRYGGEVGVYYGHSTGKVSADEFGSYLDAGIGTDKFQFNFGVSGSQLDVHFPRGRH